jgi:hypothetical protein
MKIFRMEAFKKLDDVHHIYYDCVPTSLEESTGETIRTWGLVTRHFIDGDLHLFLRKSLIKALKIRLIKK